MRKLNLLLFTIAAVLMTAMTAFAQAPVVDHAADNSAGLKAIAAGVGFAIAVVGGAIGQSRIGAAACEGAARNPGAAGKIQRSEEHTSELQSRLHLVCRLLLEK